MTAPADKREGGFTLVELLVAMVLLGLIALALSSATRLSGRALEAGTTRVDMLLQLEQLETLLRRGVSDMRVADLGAAPVVSLRSGPRELRFAAPLPPSGGMGALALYVLSTRPRKDGPTLDLVLNWALLRPERLVEPPSLAERNRVLMEGLDEVRFRYFGPAAEGEAPVWSNSWARDGEIPSAISIELASGGMPLPTILIAPRLASPLRIQ